MSRRIFRLSIFLFLISAIFISGTARGVTKGLSEEEALDESRKVTMSLVKATKKTLKSFIGEGDFLKAVKGCSEEAPSIAQKYTDQTGYYVRRVSLKYRNPDDIPDQYEKGVLEKFDSLREEGKMVVEHEDYRVVEEGGNKYLRYMKPLITKKLCLNCHGSKEDIPVTVRGFLNTNILKTVQQVLRSGM